MARPHPDIVRELKKSTSADKRYLVAVSGGIDSVVLLHSVLDVCPATNLAVAHVDHGIRSDSGENAKFVENLATDYGIPFFIQTVTPPASGDNIEAWAREERYNFFLSLLNEKNFDVCLTAHHANDVAETLLMRLLFNRPLSTIEKESRNGRIVRPFLSIPRSTIEAYASRASLAYYLDETNLDNRILRNRVRNSLIPLLEEEYHNRVVESLAERATSLQEDYDALDMLVLEIVNPVSAMKFGSREWQKALVTILETSPGAIKWRVIEKLLLPELGYKLGRSGAGSVIEFFLAGRKRVELPGSRVLTRSKGAISINHS